MKSSGSAKSSQCSGPCAALTTGFGKIDIPIYKNLAVFRPLRRPRDRHSRRHHRPPREDLAVFRPLRRPRDSYTKIYKVFSYLPSILRAMP